MLSRAKSQDSKPKVLFGRVEPTTSNHALFQSKLLELCKKNTMIGIWENAFHNNMDLILMKQLQDFGMRTIIKHYSTMALSLVNLPLFIYQQSPSYYTIFTI